MRGLTAATALLLASTCPLPASAQGPYVLAKFVTSNAGKIDRARNDAALTGQNYAIAQTTHQQVFEPVTLGFGYQFRSGFGIEALYIPPNDQVGYKALFTNGGVPAPWAQGSVTKTWEFSGHGLAAVGSMRLDEKLSLVGRAGFLMITTEVTTQTILRTGGTVFSDVSTTAKETTRASLVSVGLELEAIPKRLGMRFELEFIGDLARGLGRDNQVNELHLLSAGVVYRF